MVFTGGRRGGNSAKRRKVDDMSSSQPTAAVDIYFITGENLRRQDFQPFVTSTGSGGSDSSATAAQPAGPTSDSGSSGSSSQDSPTASASDSSSSAASDGSSASSDTTTPPPSSSPTSSSTSPSSTPPTQSSTPSSTPSATPSSILSVTSSGTSSSASTSSNTPSPSSNSSTATPTSTPTSTPSSNSQTSSSSISTPTPTSSTSNNGTEVWVTSKIVISSNGVPISTVYTTFPSTLADPSSGMSTATRRGVIIGSVVGGVAFIGLIFAVVFFYRRHQHKKLNFFRRQPRPRRSMLLEGEDMDDYDLGPRMQSYQDYPSSMDSRAQSYSHAPSPLPETAMVARNTPSPHLLGLRASDSGSIFQEAVWPPPKTLVDPLISESDDLHRIVDDVMGPSNVSPFGAGASVRTAASASASTLPRTHARAMHSVSSDDSPTGHGRSTSQTALLPPDSPGSPTFPRSAPLFVTNMGSPTSTGSPPLPGRTTRWLERSPKKVSREVKEEDEGEFVMGEAL